MPKFLNATELAAILGVNTETIYRKVRNENMPHLRIGRSLRFDLDTVIKWFSEKRI